MYAAHLPEIARPFGSAGSAKKVEAELRTAVMSASASTGVL